MTATAANINRRTVEREDLRADVTIIGAGFAGLVAGALLSKDGFKVRILERDIHPGGCAARFERKHALGTFGFAVGATVCAGLEPGGLLDSIYKKLGISRSLPNLDPVMRLHLNERKALVPGTRGGWSAELPRAFPGQEREKTRFWKEIQSLSDVMHHVARRFPSMPFKSSIASETDRARNATSETTTARNVSNSLASETIQFTGGGKPGGNFGTKMRHAWFAVR